MSRRQCPRCSRTDVKRVRPKALSFGSDYMCRTCGTMWRPAWPEFGPVIAIVLGFYLAGAAYVLVKNYTLMPRAAAPPPPQGLWYGVGTSAVFLVHVLAAISGIAGLISGIYGVGVLVGKWGRLRILREGQPPPGPDRPEPDQPAGPKSPGTSGP